MPVNSLSVVYWIMVGFMEFRCVCGSTGLGPEAELSACHPHTSSRKGLVMDSWTVLSAPHPP